MCFNVNFKRKLDLGIVGSQFKRDISHLAKKAERGSVLFLVVVMMGAWLSVSGFLISGILWSKKTVVLALKERQSWALLVSSLPLAEHYFEAIYPITDPFGLTDLKKVQSQLFPIPIVDTQWIYLGKTAQTIYVLTEVDGLYFKGAKIDYQWVQSGDHSVLELKGLDLL